jgi:hypothetical protein
LYVLGVVKEENMIDYLVKGRVLFKRDFFSISLNLSRKSRFKERRRALMYRGVCICVCVWWRRGGRVKLVFVFCVWR